MLDLPSLPRDSSEHSLDQIFAYDLDSDNNISEKSENTEDDLASDVDLKKNTVEEDRQIA